MSDIGLEYRSAATVDEALQLWAGRSGSCYLAGGTDLIPRLRAGATEIPGYAIDIKRIPGSREIGEQQDGSVTIGATASVASVAAHPLIRKRYPALVDCCLQIGSYPLRNIATVAGNICNASPCADSSAALLCLDAEVQTATADGPRTLSIHEFFDGPGVSALRPGELVTALTLPAASAGGDHHYGRIARRRGVDISTVAALVLLLPDRQPRHRIALLSVAPRPLRVPLAEALLDEQGADGAGEAAELARQAASPITDVRGTAEYRDQMVGVLVRRGIEALASKAGRS